MQFKPLIFSLLLFLIGFNSKAQICLNDIDADRIEQDKVQEFLVTQQENGIETFEEIKPSMQTNSDTKDYFVRENVYHINKDIEEVWSYYLNTDPDKLWNGKKVSLGFLFSKKDDKIVYFDENSPKIDTGMVVYLNLKLMSGLKNIATAFEFINIDKENKVIEFSYLSGNVSEGKQRVEFFETPKGYTQILHTSFYRSNTFLKNYLLYPYFHTRTTNEFHRNLKRLILHR